METLPHNSPASQEPRFQASGTHESTRSLDRAVAGEAHSSPGGRSRGAALEEVCFIVWHQGLILLGHVSHQNPRGQGQGANVPASPAGCSDSVATWSQFWALEKPLGFWSTAQHWAPAAVSSPGVFPGAEGERKSTESFLQVSHAPGTQGEGREPDFRQKWSLQISRPWPHTL